jgi:FkbH-like protein
MDLGEDVRLVIWDLDETYWKGTLTEGGISEYLTANHDAVIELAKRGIVSSICSKNDHELIERILTDAGIWDYFVLPSISWEPKGPRLAAMVESFGLRAPTVLFLDDNASNRAEAAAMVPGLQVADESFASVLLSHARLKGKSDPEMTRLAQYKVLETKKRDEALAGGDSRDFLRNSGIVVEFEFDVAAHIDRAVELVNRTNQLNFTKTRLPEDPEKARAQLLKSVNQFWTQSALIRVRDKYGDYGYCGFFLRGNGQGGGSGPLFHFCFSCRTLGMLVERWVYDYLGRPRLKVVGDVLTDLWAPQTVDWISYGQSGSGAVITEKPLPEVRLRGGCEIDALAHYFTPVANEVTRETSRARGPFFLPKDCSHHLWLEPPTDADFLDLVEICGYERSDMMSDLLGPCPPGTLFVLSTWLDVGNTIWRHKSGNLLSVSSMGSQALDRTEKETEQRLKGQRTPDELAQLMAVFRKLKESAQPVPRREEADVRRRLKAVFNALPQGCRVAVLGLDEVTKERDADPVSDPESIQYNKWLAYEAEAIGAKLFYVGDYIERPSDRERTGHFDRIVYYRLATAIIDWAATPQPAADAAQRWPKVQALV